MTEASREGEPLTMIEDDKGTYVMNSKDMNMLLYLDKLISAGVSSFKIEGRMKSEYYVASTVTAYRRALDGYYKTGIYSPSESLVEELEKTSHRRYTTGFYLRRARHGVLGHVKARKRLAVHCRGQRLRRK